MNYVTELHESALKISLSITFYQINTWLTMDGLKGIRNLEFCDTDAVLYQLNLSSQSGSWSSCEFVMYDVFISFCAVQIPNLSYIYSHSPYFALLALNWSGMRLSPVLNDLWFTFLYRKICHPVWISITSFYLKKKKIHLTQKIQNLEICLARYGFLWIIKSWPIKCRTRLPQINLVEVTKFATQHLMLLAFYNLRIQSWRGP